MKKILIGVLLAGVSGVTMADCTTQLSHGQYKQICDSSNHSNKEDIIEYSEVSRAGVSRLDERNKTQETYNPKTQQEQTQVAQSQTALQPEQIQQLIEYANRQGCKWQGVQHRSLLICPK